MANGVHELEKQADGKQVAAERHSSRRRRRRRRWYEKLPAWVREYWIEWALVSAVLVAIFLLVEPWQIRASLFTLARSGMGLLSSTLGAAVRSVFAWARGLTLSDATAVMILLGVLVIAGWRLRYRVVNSERYWHTHCPECGSSLLHRTHRRFGDRVLGRLGFPVRRYSCSSCGWRGLRIHNKAGAPFRMPQPPAGA